MMLNEGNNNKIIWKTPRKSTESYLHAHVRACTHTEAGHNVTKGFWRSEQPQPASGKA